MNNFMIDQYFSKRVFPRHPGSLKVRISIPENAVLRGQVESSSAPVSSEVLRTKV